MSARLRNSQKSEDCARQDARPPSRPSECPAESGERLGASPAKDGGADRRRRAKDYLNESGIAALLEAAKTGRHGVRDHLLLLMMFRHALRVSQLIGLRRDEVDLDQGRLWIHRTKSGLTIEHPIVDDERRAIKGYLATRSDALPWLFISERARPFTRQAVNYLTATAAVRAGLPPIHPHLLRHACAFALASKYREFLLVKDYLGHLDPKHTALYYVDGFSGNGRFAGLWNDQPHTASPPPGLKRKKFHTRKASASLPDRHGPTDG